MGEPAPYEQGAGSHHPADIFPAKSLGGTLAEVITYDRRMAEAAEALGMSVVAPGAVASSTESSGPARL